MFAFSDKNEFQGRGKQSPVIQCFCNHLIPFILDHVGEVGHCHFRRFRGLCGAKATYLGAQYPHSSPQQAGVQPRILPSPPVCLLHVRVSYVWWTAEPHVQGPMSGFHPSSHPPEETAAS